MIRLAAALLVPGLLFVALCGTRGGPCLDSYTWTPGVGYAPTAARCDVDARPGMGAGAGFFARAAGGLLTGRSGRSREDAARPLFELLMHRGGRSGAIVAFALGVLALHVLASAWGERRRRLRGPFPMPPQPARVIAPPFGLPLPIAGFALFALVVRLVPPDSPLDYDRAGLLWAGLALAWADGVAALGFAGMQHASAAERRRPWAQALRLQGPHREAAVAEASSAARATQLRAALLGLVGGLLVVEGIFGVNGLGETLRDLIVDRRGLDPLLLVGVLLAFSFVVATISAVPLERLVARWRT